MQRALRTAGAKSLLLLVLTLPSVLQAQFTFTTNNGALTITGYTGAGGDVIIPSTINGLPVISIGSHVFYENISLNNITIPNSIKSIGLESFAFCSSLTSISIPNSVTNIGDHAFEVCTTLASVTIGTNVTRIEDNAFVNCTSLSSITIPDSVTSIGAGVFGSCTSLASATVGNSVTNIGGGAFNSCWSLASILIPDRVSSIGRDTFQACGSLTNATIGIGVTNIGSYAFNSCTSLGSITIPDSVITIGNNAFDSCTSLASVTIPASITSIGGMAFDHCIRLASVTIPSSVTNIGNRAFSYCTSLGTITMHALNSYFSSLDGVLFNKSTNTLIQCPGGKAGSYVIPGNVTTIGNFAFAGCASLSSVTIPNTVTSIGSYAFNSCTSFTGAYFQGNAPGPGTDLTVFTGDNYATIYYLDGTIGWGTTFDGRPTVAPWTPQVQTRGSSFGVQTNQFGFNLIGGNGMVIVVEASTNLANPVWSPLQTNTLTSGSVYFSDPQWTNYRTRFYRLRSP